MANPMSLSDDQMSALLAMDVKPGQVPIYDADEDLGPGWKDTESEDDKFAALNEFKQMLDQNVRQPSRGQSYYGCDL
jgi:hypothetical protein